MPAGRARQRARCPSCAAEFCTECGGAYHYVLACAEVAQASAGWLRWQDGGRAKYLADTHQAAAAASAATEAAAAAAREAAARLEELRRDEQWKAAHLRLCPHCGRPVERVDGCDKMVCGRDADDKGGGNRQARGSRSDSHV